MTESGTTQFPWQPQAVTPLLIAGLVILAFYQICLSSSDYSETLVQYHAAVTSIAVDGHPTVELFGPLSCVLSLHRWSFMSIMDFMKWPLLAMMLRSDLSNRRTSDITLAGLIVSASIAQALQTTTTTNALATVCSTTFWFLSNSISPISSPACADFGGSKELYLSRYWLLES